MSNGQVTLFQNQKGFSFDYGKQEIKAQAAHVGGETYLNTMGLRLMEGRHFHSGQGTDRNESVIVNQTLIEQLHLRHPIGQRLKIDSAYATIVGVVADYKQFGLHSKVSPCILRVASNQDFRYLVVRAAQAKLAQVHEQVKAAWQKVTPAVPFRGYLQKEVVAKEAYLNQGFRSAAFFLALVTIALSASGLFALVSLQVIKRSKEIRVRKVLGASGWQLVTILQTEFIRVVSIAFVIGSALGYLLIDKLVFRFIFVYHPVIGPGAFLTTFLVIVGAGCLTIGRKVYQAATANPIEFSAK